MSTTVRASDGRSPLAGPSGPLLTPGSARSLLITVLGELVWPTAGPVRTSALVHVLGRLGVEEQAARQSIARAAASDWITASKQGREVLWTLSDKLVHIFETGSRRVYTLSDPFDDWDGQWLTLVVNLPHAQRARRRPLYAGLTWAGLGNPAPGLWITPHVERVAEVRSLLESLELRRQSIALIGRLDAATGTDAADLVARGWDLDGLSEQYDQVERAVAGLPAADDSEVLVSHVRMINTWQEFPRSDPQLPESLLPDWIGRRVARTIERRRAEWAPAVRRAFASLQENA